MIRELNNSAELARAVVKDHQFHRDKMNMPKTLEYDSVWNPSANFFQFGNTSGTDPLSNEDAAITIKTGVMWMDKLSVNPF